MLTTVISASLLVPGAAFAAEQGTTTATSVSKEGSSTNSKAEHKYKEADAKITKDEAVQRIRKLFPHLKDAEVQSVQFGEVNQYPIPNENVWTIIMQITEANESRSYRGKVAADTGDVLSFQLSSSGYSGERQPKPLNYPPKVSKEQARELAKAFILQASPSLKTNNINENTEDRYIAYNTSLFGPVRYSFAYDVYAEGVKVQGGDIRVNVDGNGDITEISRQTPASEFPSSKPKLTLEQASKFAKDNQMAELQYIPERRGARTTKWFLAYSPLLYNIDAQSGQIMDHVHQLGESGRTYKSVPATASAYKGFKGQADMTSEQAGKIAEDAFSIPKDLKLSDTSLRSDWGNTKGKVWTLNWMGEEQQRFGNSIYAVIHAKEGIVISYNNSQYRDNSKKDGSSPAISREDAEKKVIDLLNKVYPNASQELKQVVASDSSSNKTNYSFTFQRFYKDIPVSGDTVSINMDLQGNISNYNANRSDVADKELDAIKHAVTKEQAMEKIWNNTKLELQYASSRGDNPGNLAEPNVMNLVYVQSLKDNPNTPIVDATDGKWKKQWYDGAENQFSINPIDIKGHAAEKELNTLVQFNVLSTDESGKVNPNQVVTIGDWWKMIAKAVTPYYEGYSSSNEIKQPFADIDEKNDYYDAVRFAIQSKWLKADIAQKLNPEQEVTREQFASYLVTVAKYSKVSNELASKLPSVPYSDASQITNKGDVWLAVQLGLLKTKDGKFNPKDKVTRADAAVAIMNLVYMQGKFDQNVTNHNMY
ncbi:S-layer homology domain-containing protein [Paenibacillus sp. N1-5-1-14]|uniref:YcdB/YcdC domain-containing protein n=1 Tax=Paenibacillus radicibacter TaxID=2972488 RepID=UPI002158DF23|nr:YcdB/YcdC domain-containing protein [Paenibacillus radicibacter]MCR8645688.1 S-layer homology domain-containing protein [Paenibacillus radicibacter]